MVNPPVMTLEQLAALPLDRIVVSACCATGGDGLGPVGGIKAKFEAATSGLSGDRSLVAFGIATDQKNLPDDPVVVRGGTLGELLSALSPVLPRLFGPILSLPLGLDGVAGDHYDARHFHPFPWLNAKIAQALSEDAKREQPGGYLFIEGGPARGKTSWALDWQRASAGFSQSPATGASAGRLPPLTAWFFARRYGFGNGFGNPYLREENALQTLISMARLRRNAPSSAESRLLLADLNHSYDYRNIEDQKRLGSAFQTALTDLAASEPRPSAEHPLLLLLDGADELFSQGEGTFQVRHVFPEIFPKQLPPWTYLVILSRPGRHLLLGQADIQPVLHYQFTKEDVEQAIDHYLNAVALNEANPFDLDEQKILRDPDFQRQVREASEGAFGYVTRLMDDLIKQPNAKQSRARNRLAQLRRWRDVPGSLPQGVYEQRARELVGLCQALEEQQRGQARRLTRALASLALLQEQPLLSVAGLTDLVVEPAERPEPPVAHSPLPKAASATTLTQTSPSLPISLADLATLPLERVVVSGYCRSALTDEALGPVSRLCENLATPVPAEILAFGGAAGQMELSAKWPTIAAGTLSELLGGLNQFLAPRVFGPILEPPPTLLDSLSHTVGHADYVAAFAKLNQAVVQALLTAPSGYLFIEGEPASGKTRWALDWQRYSARHDPLMSTTAYPLPPLSAWFFAGHDGVGATSGDPAYLKEVNALQTLISMARRQRGVQAREHRVHLLSPALAADYDYQNREQQTVLREAFQAALHELATARHAPPTANNPLLLLLDGADRLFGAADGVLQPRIGFPWIFPDALPDHTYLVIVSRPGQHLWLGQRDMTPLLRYQLSAELPTSAAPSDLAQPPLSEPCAVEYQETVAKEGMKQHVWHEKKQIRKALGEAHQFFMGPPPGQTLVFLQFDHSLTAELALAKQQVESTVDLFTVTGDTVKQWHLIAYCVQSTTDHAEKPDFEPPQGVRLLSASERQAANACLHRAIGERSARYWPTLDTVRPASKTAIAEWPSKRRYAVLWGLYHAFQGAVGCTEQDASPAVAKALPLLLHAGYLQTAVRVGGEGSLDALRETYIAADQVPNAQEDQSLRYRIEGAVLEWHSHLTNGSLQVGALLWNLLGGWSLTKDRSIKWKNSLDQKALLTTLAAMPTDLNIKINGYNQQALSACGQWLVTASSSGAAVWDLRRGVHHLRQVAALPKWDSEKLCCVVVGNTLYLLGSRGQLVLTGCIDLLSNRVWVARFRSAGTWINSIALCANRDGFVGLSGSVDGTVNVLCMRQVDLIHISQEESTDSKLGWISHFRGYQGVIESVMLRTDGEDFLGLIQNSEGIVGVLHLTSNEVKKLAHHQNKSIHTDYIPKEIAYFQYGRGIESITLHIDTQGLVVLSGSSNGTVGVLYLTRKEVKKLASHQIYNKDNEGAPAQIARFKVCQGSITSMALYMDAQGLVVLSGSWNGIVGILYLTREELEKLAWYQSHKKDNEGLPAQITRFKVHESRITSAALHVDAEGLVALSGSQDGIVRALYLPRNHLKKIAWHQTEAGKTESELTQIFLFQHGGEIRSLILHTDKRGLLGVSSSQDSTIGLLFMQWEEVKKLIDEQNKTREVKTGCIARFSGHENRIGYKHSILSFALQVDGQELIGLSSSVDDTIGILRLHRDDVISFIEQQKNTGDKNSELGQIIHFSGQRTMIPSIALNIYDGELIGLCGGLGSIEVLALGRSELVKVIAQQDCSEEKKLIPSVSWGLTEEKTNKDHVKFKWGELGRIARFRFGSWLPQSVGALHVDGVGLVGLYGSENGTVGIVCLQRDELIRIANQQTYNKDQWGNLGWIACFRRHGGEIRSAALHVDGDKLVALCGSVDRTIGVLCLRRDEVAGIAEEQARDKDQWGKRGQLARFSGHKDVVQSVAIYTDSEKLLGLSSSYDHTVGLLYLQRGEVEKLAEQQALSNQPEPGRIARFHNPIMYHWHSKHSAEKDNAIPTFWGISPQAVVQVTVKTIDVNTSQLIFDFICPFNEPNFIPHDITQLDEDTIVIGGACDKDVALLFLEWVTPSDGA